MEKLLKKGIGGIVARLFHMEDWEEHGTIHVQLQSVLHWYTKVFEEILKGLLELRWLKIMIMPLSQYLWPLLPTIDPIGIPISQKVRLF